MGQVQGAGLFMAGLGLLRARFLLAPAVPHLASPILGLVLGLRSLPWALRSACSHVILFEPEVGEEACGSRLPHTSPHALSSYLGVNLHFLWRP